MATPDKEKRYAAETWSAVQTLWNLFDEQAERSIALTHPETVDMIGANMRKRSPQAAALQIVVQVVTDDITKDFTPAAKKEALAEINSLTQMNFDEAQGYMTSPFMHAFVNAWQIVRTWIDEGKLEASASEFLMSSVVGALKSGAPPKQAAPKQALPKSADDQRRQQPSRPVESTPAGAPQQAKPMPLRTMLLALGIVGVIVLVIVWLYRS
jgi:Flp pilus assembly protein TadB